MYTHSQTHSHTLVIKLLDEYLFGVLSSVEDYVPSTWDIPLSVKTFMQDDRATNPHNGYDIENIADDYVENITSYFDTIPYAIIEICTFKFFSEEALVFLKKHNATKLANVYVQALVIPTCCKTTVSPRHVVEMFLWRWQQHRLLLLQQHRWQLFCGSRRLRTERWCQNVVEELIQWA
jgi:hypothetical protein